MVKRRPTAELVLLREEGRCWRETRRPLPDSGSGVVVRFEPMVLGASAWALCVLECAALSIVRVGTSGASWAKFPAESRVQVWLPGTLSVGDDVAVEVELSDGTDQGGAEAA